MYSYNQCYVESLLLRYEDVEKGMKIKLCIVQHNNNKPPNLRKGRIESIHFESKIKRKEEEESNGREDKMKNFPKVIVNIMIITQQSTKLLFAYMPLGFDPSFSCPIRPIKGLF